jgi:probable F420-dependent oxidoreductase
MSETFIVADSSRLSADPKRASDRSAKALRAGVRQRLIGSALPGPPPTLNCVRLGLGLPHYDTSLAGEAASWSRVKRIAQTAEAAGFDSVWVSDHLFLDWGKYGGPATLQGALECWTTLSAVAAATTRVRVGSLALCNDFRHPALVAKMAAAVDLLSGGRLEVGLGAGWYEAEYERAGIQLDRPVIRIERLGEAVEIVRRLLEGEELHFSGKHYQIDGAVCRPGPHKGSRPPIWVGGKGDLLLATAARVADGWNMSWLGSAEAYRDRLRVILAACAAAGREGSSLRRSVGAYVLVGRDEADARARFERLVERTPWGVLRSITGKTAVSWEQFRHDHFAGTAGEVTDRLGVLKELGIEEVIVSVGTLPFQVADEDDVERVAELAPALR